MCRLMKGFSSLRVVLAMAAMGTLASCGSLGIRSGPAMPISACGEAWPDAFVSGAQRFPGRASAMGFIDKDKASVYSYMNFDQIEEYAETAKGVTA